MRDHIGLISAFIALAVVLVIAWDIPSMLRYTPDEAGFYYSIMLYLTIMVIFTVPMLLLLITVHQDTTDPVRIALRQVLVRMALQDRKLNINKIATKQYTNTLINYGVVKQVKPPFWYRVSHGISHVPDKFKPVVVKVKNKNYRKHVVT